MTEGIWRVDRQLEGNNANADAAPKGRACVGDRRSDSSLPVEWFNVGFFT